MQLQPRVVLVHGRPSAPRRSATRLGRYTTRRLAKPASSSRLDRRLTRVPPDRVELDDGESIETATVVSTVGNAPHPVLATLPTRHDGAAGSRPTPPSRVPGLEHVWALGDCASIVDPKTGRPMPATAQHAVREGPHAARNVLAALDGLPQTPFSYDQLGMLVSLGRFRARGRDPGPQGQRLHRLVHVAQLLPAAPAELGSPPPRRARLDARAACLKRDIVEISVVARGRALARSPGSCPASRSRPAPAPTRTTS